MLPICCNSSNNILTLRKGGKIVKDTNLQKVSRENYIKNLNFKISLFDYFIWIIDHSHDTNNFNKKFNLLPRKYMKATVNIFHQHFLQYFIVLI